MPALKPITLSSPTGGYHHSRYSFFLLIPTGKQFADRLGPAEICEVEMYGGVGPKVWTLGFFSDSA